MLLPEGDSTVLYVLAFNLWTWGQIGPSGFEPESPAGGGALPLSYSPFVGPLLLIAFVCNPPLTTWIRHIWL